jgi:hypothetical protein
MSNQRKSEILNSKSEANLNDRNTNPPKADKIQNKEGTDWSAFCPKTKNSPASAFHNGDFGGRQAVKLIKASAQLFP